MEPLEKKVKDLWAQIEETSKKLGILELRNELHEIDKKMLVPDFWHNAKEASELSKRRAFLVTKTQPWADLRESLSDTTELLVYYEGDEGNKSIYEDLLKQYQRDKQTFDQLKKELRFNGPYDDHDVILSIYAGAGGTDAQDWAQMLLRMYSRWAENHKLAVKTVDQSSGETAGIKSVTLEITSGSFLYGKLAGEHGVHRLVRKSPFNSAGSRETSFAKVDVLPMIDRPEEVLIDDKDLKIDTFRAGGHGGQSVNTTDSAVRVTHIPTGVSVAIQNERSQLQNKETALTILRSRLAQLQVEQHVDALSEIKGPSQANEFGSQIRNYILDDRILKDLRTGYENHDPQKILDGDLDPLIDAWLENR